MSKLLELGFTPEEAGKAEAYVNTIKAVNKLDIKSVRAAVNAYNSLIEQLAYSSGRDKYRLLSRQAIRNFCAEHLDLPVAECRVSENPYPICLLEKIGSAYIAFIYILSGDTDYEYDAEGRLMKRTFLYGDRNILPYSTDPLQYLRFRCMPDEQTAYSSKKTLGMGIDKAHDDAEYSGVAPVLLGIELEVERKESTPPKIEHMVAADLGMEYMILKSDSSIQNGFEIVTCPATLRFHLKSWDKFFENSAKYLKSWSAKSCGMHVHISRKALTPMHLGKMITFYNNPENREFLTSIAGRNSSYAEYSAENPMTVKTRLVSDITQLMADLRKAKGAKKIAEIEAKIAGIRASMAKNQHRDSEGFVRNIVQFHQPTNSGNPRHSAINLCKKGTVEIRIFKGNVSKIGMLKNVEFVHAVLEFTREATFRTRTLNEEEKAERILKRKENTDYALHHTYFIDWLSKDETGNYNNLKLWLQEHKISDKFLKKKVSSKAPANKQITSSDIRAVA